MGFHFSPQMSNFGESPGRAGGLPKDNYFLNILIRQLMQPGGSGAVKICALLTGKFFILFNPPGTKKTVAGGTHLVTLIAAGALQVSDGPVSTGLSQKPVRINRITCQAMRAFKGLEMQMAQITPFQPVNLLCFHHAPEKFHFFAIIEFIQVRDILDISHGQIRAFTAQGDIPLRADDKTCEREWAKIIRPAAQFIFTGRNLGH